VSIPPTIFRRRRGYNRGLALGGFAKTNHNTSNQISTVSTDATHTIVMASPITIKFLGPTTLAGYNRKLHAESQPSTIPQTFLDAMEVREEVFVKGQGVPLSMEADSDDARSCHWVAYATPTENPGLGPIPAGTVRLVPFPHDPHPEPGSEWDIPEESEHIEADGGSGNSLIVANPPWIIDRETTLHDGKEPYIKFGRLAVMEGFRGRGIADIMVNTAIQWAKENPQFFDPKGPIVGAEGEDLDVHRMKWNGLICAHAQEYVSKAWAKWGFVIDEKMGKWNEAEIPHVGMFLRLDVS
jgi:predicted GNAT family N-acyltransferase